MELSCSAVPCAIAIAVGVSAVASVADAANLILSAPSLITK
jgi:hypothetical protein